MNFITKWILIGSFLIGMYYVGSGLALTVQKMEVISSGIMETLNWGLGFGESGEVPTGNTSATELEKYNAFYYKDTMDKEIFLTFDAGFENGNTDKILDALSKHNVMATFFLVGHYLESEPDLVKRMIEEGHIVANHSYSHPDMTLLNKEEFTEELVSLEILYKDITGEELYRFYRAPQGKYSMETLEYAEELGYETIFWSLAYVDWYEDNQPTKEEAFDKLLGRIHPGAIVLLHSTSETNAEILEELITKWKEMGYEIKPLTEL
ncbi:MAG: polysaccharide deacetylase family protein [Eubacteriales bacterium]